MDVSGIIKFDNMYIVHIFFETCQETKNINLRNDNFSETNVHLKISIVIYLS